MDMINNFSLRENRRLKIVSSLPFQLLPSPYKIASSSDAFRHKKAD